MSCWLSGLQMIYLSKWRTVLHICTSVNPIKESRSYYSLLLYIPNFLQPPLASASLGPCRRSVCRGKQKCKKIALISPKTPIMSPGTYFKTSGSGFLLETKNADRFVILIVDSRPPKHLLDSEYKAGNNLFIGWPHLIATRLHRVTG